MQKGTGTKRRALMALLGVSLVLSACGGGVAQEEFDAVKQQLAAKDQEAASLRQQAQEAAKLKQDLDAANAAKKNVVWSVRPDAKPIPTAAPRPPGFTPPPPPQPPAARVVPLFFYVDTVTAGAGESKYKVDATYGCMRSSVFKRGQRIVWRMEVVDTSNGKVLQAADVESAVLKLPHGENLRLGFGRHGRTEADPWFWAVGWDIPPDYPLGSLVYTIEVATKDGKKGTFKEMSLLPGFVDLLQTTRPDPELWKMTNAGLTIIE